MNIRLQRHLSNMNILIIKHVNKYASLISLSFGIHASLITSDRRTTYKWFHPRVGHFFPRHHWTRQPTRLRLIVVIFYVGGDRACSHEEQYQSQQQERTKGFEGGGEHNPSIKSEGKERFQIGTTRLIGRRKEEVFVEDQVLHMW